MAGIERILFISQWRVEALRPPRATALISITDPRHAPVVLEAGWRRVLRVTFDDIDPVAYPDDYEGMRAISDAQALEIAAFVRLASEDCRRVVVHCRHGISRSAGVAKAIAHHLERPFPPTYGDENRFVYRAMRWALEEPT